MLVHHHRPSHTGQHLNTHSQIQCNCSRTTLDMIIKLDKVHPQRAKPVTCLSQYQGPRKFLFSRPEIMILPFVIVNLISLFQAGCLLACFKPYNAFVSLIQLHRIALLGTNDAVANSI